MGLKRISRREILAATLASPFAFSSAMAQQRERPPAIAGETVQEFVIAGHRDLEKVKEMLADVPPLLNATWDWGAGDFETALGGAGHMGRRDIAEHLIGEGARADVFVHAMLGDLDVVKAMLTRFPNLKDAKGPHGIPLKRHAEKGEERARAVLEYLESLG